MGWFSLLHRMLVGIGMCFEGSISFRVLLRVLHLSGLTLRYGSGVLTSRTSTGLVLQMLLLKCAAY